MKSKVSFTYWQDSTLWLGYLEKFPDQWTQGKSFEDLKEHLADLHKELFSAAIPSVRHHAEMELELA